MAYIACLNSWDFNIHCFPGNGFYKIYGEFIKDIRPPRRSFTPFTATGKDIKNASPLSKTANTEILENIFNVWSCILENIFLRVSHIYASMTILVVLLTLGLVFQYGIGF